MQAQTHCTPVKIRNRTVAVLRGKVLDVRRTSGGLLHTPPACALAEELLCQADALGCEEILLTVDEGTTFRTSFQDFKQRSFPIQRGGFEPQRALLLSDWIADLHIESRALAPGEVKYRSLQMSLFG